MKWLKKTKLFTRMTKKDELWKQDSEKTKLFKKIKKKFTEKPILKIYQLALPIKVEINILDFALGACLL